MHRLRFDQRLKPAVCHKLLVEGHLVLFAHAFQALVSHYFRIHFVTAGSRFENYPCEDNRLIAARTRHP